jgi:hypothetical protein
VPSIYMLIARARVQARAPEVVVPAGEPAGAAVFIASQASRSTT